MPRYAVSSFVPDAPYWCFQWPASGRAHRTTVLAGMPDPKLFKVHPLPCREPASLHFALHAMWAVLEIPDDLYREKGGWVEFEQGDVVFTGSPLEASDFLRQHGLLVPESTPVVQAGDFKKAEVGKFSVVIGGEESTVRAGDCGVAFATTGVAEVAERGFAISRFATVVGGERSFAITLYGREATTGDYGVARADEFGRATAGRKGIAIVENGTAMVGEEGLAISEGSQGISVAGDAGIAMISEDYLGNFGCAMAGDGGILAARVADGERIRLLVAYVGENGIKPNTYYTVNELGQFVESAMRAD
jgi:hypothetical protein